MLIRTEGRGSSETQVTNRERWETVIWWGAPDDDPIARRLDDAVAAIENTCRPAIQEVIRVRTQ
jgi:hypothetical protein